VSNPTNSSPAACDDRRTGIYEAAKRSVKRRSALACTTGK
jgi:hypothetical protein